MSFKTKFISITGLTLLASLTLFLYFKALNTNIYKLDNIWRENTTLFNQKSVILNDIRNHFGYGGFIHHFKNLILRQDKSYIPLAEKSLTLTFKALHDYEKLALTHNERLALMEIERVINHYSDKFVLAKQLLSQNLSPEKIDYQVKVDDREAFEGFQKLSNIVKYNNILIANRANWQLDQIKQLLTISFIAIQPLLLITGLFILFSINQMTLHLAKI